jgi:DNA-binding response OmpR family regulator
MKKIMIVDDEPDLRKMLNLMLNNEGIESIFANDGNEFLDKVEEENPGLVLLDVMMPGPSTKEILNRLKNLNCDPKIILLTVVRYHKEDIEDFKELGNIVEYVKKPFEMEYLINIIKKHLKSR